ncbi:uncharacterized protein BDR25DRAFT_268387 [Lindgomyces ingoldianus]|uniref:Uncharacterized protein n=1 Tax=Lindgomyces ingoldianus TaxID=673940 RepID=A0ACB6QIW9_9PLEO|nr:uncharacterized protein BDR25DRAFT_268387 [Lindgomyces ingoldianus]KAF2466845.1 hypothetical protein BDR25DRAFT_268387 [Lindgomyces ingoldianus]
MADDTRQSSSSPQNARPVPKGPANIMPGGTAHTAGGIPADYEPSYVDAVKSLGPEYYLNFHKRPCVRDSQLMGIGAGFVGMGLAAILRRPVMMCCHYAVFSWVGVSCVSYQYCQYQRSREKKGMQMARDLMEQKRANFEAKREARRKAREDQERLEEERRKEEERRTSWSYWFKTNTRFW